jgi:hypothetical protein
MDEYKSSRPLRSMACRRHSSAISSCKKLYDTWDQEYVDSEVSIQVWKVRCDLKVLHASVANLLQCNFNICNPWQSY